MVYRGFTWNLTASESAAVWRLCHAVLDTGYAKHVEADASRLLSLYRHYDEVRTDGKAPPQYLYADS